MFAVYFLLVNDGTTHPRLVTVPEFRRRNAGMTERMEPALFRSDPLADAVIHDVAPEHMSTVLRQSADRVGGPTSVRALLDTLRTRPSWYNEARIRRGGTLLFKAAAWGGLVLAVKSLVEGYASPQGNKPLVFSGRLETATNRRLQETTRFVHAVATPGGMAPGGEGFDITLRVRLIHARVRQLVESSGRWRSDLWGVPINQHDMLGTIFLFSTVFIDGVRNLGVAVNDDEAEEYYQLWRWAGWVIGVEESLLPASYAEALEMTHWIEKTRGAPDDDSRSLTRALLLGPFRDARTRFEKRLRDAHFASASAFCRRLVGQELADALDLPGGRWASAIDRMCDALQTRARIKRYVPVSDGRIISRGERYWQRVLARGPAIAVDTFVPAARLGRLL